MGFSHRKLAKALNYRVYRPGLTRLLSLERADECSRFGFIFEIYKKRYYYWIRTIYATEMMTDSGG